MVPSISEARWLVAAMLVVTAGGACEKSPDRSESMPEPAAAVAATTSSPGASSAAATASEAAAYTMSASPAQSRPDYERARWDPIHFKPAIDEAADEDCLRCHHEILDRRPLERSPAGIQAATSLAWYQQLTTYAGPQETFHRRHLVTPLATRLMSLRCNTCHQGSSPREEAPIPPVSGRADFALRKTVDPETTCLKCHGQLNYQLMGLPGPWPDVRETMGNNCLLCHAGIRTNRHRVTYLKAEAIDEAGKESSDVCFGCHGGRSWYRISYPYPRHAWPGMPEVVPDWAKGRPAESEARFVRQ